MSWKGGPSPHPATLGCGCRVRCYHPWETFDNCLPWLKGQLVRVATFDEVCDRHKPYALSGVKGVVSASRTVRRQEGHSENRFWVITGDALTREQQRQIEEISRNISNLQRQMEAAQGEAIVRQTEQHLIAKGWTREEGNLWTAPEELRQARASRGAGRYVKTTFGHAVNTQRLIDGGVPRQEQRRLLAVEMGRTPQRYDEEGDLP